MVVARHYQELMAASTETAEDKVVVDQVLVTAPTETAEDKVVVDQVLVAAPAETAEDKVAVPIAVDQTLVAVPIAVAVDMVAADIQSWFLIVVDIQYEAVADLEWVVGNNWLSLKWLLGRLWLIAHDTSSSLQTRMQKKLHSVLLL